MFLAQVHRNTTLPNLKRVPDPSSVSVVVSEHVCQGHENLRKSVSSHTELLKTTMNENFERFIAAKDTIDGPSLTHTHGYDIVMAHVCAAIHAQLRATEIEESGASARLLEEREKIAEKAEKIFRPLLERRAHIERLRTSLSVLKRFQFIFGTTPQMHMKRREMSMFLTKAQGCPGDWRRTSRRGSTNSWCATTSAASSTRACPSLPASCRCLSCPSLEGERGAI